MIFHYAPFFIKKRIKEGLKGNCVPLAVGGAVSIIKEKQRSQKH